MNDGKGNTILLTIIGIATLLIAVIGATFAYFTAILSTNEQQQAFTVTAANIGTVYEGSDSVIVEPNIWPREESWGQKKFTIKGTSGGDANIYYTVGLVVTENTFYPGHLKYSLTIDPTSSSNGTKLNAVSLANVPATGVTADLGTGIFNGPTNGEQSHIYYLDIYFPETGQPQNASQEKSLLARISVDVITSGEMEHTTTVQ